MLRAEAAEHNVYRAMDKVYPTEMVLKRPINGMGDVQAHMAGVAMKQWEKEGERSANTQKALGMLKEFLGELGYL